MMKDSGHHPKASASEFYPVSTVRGSNKVVERGGHLKAIAREFHPNTAISQHKPSVEGNGRNSVAPCEINIAASEFYPRNSATRDSNQTTKKQSPPLSVAASEWRPVSTNSSTFSLYQQSVRTKGTNYHALSFCQPGHKSLWGDSFHDPLQKHCTSSNDIWDFQEVLESPTTMQKRNEKVKQIPCKFFLQGACQNGASCPFVHDAKNYMLKNTTSKKRDENQYYSIYPGISCKFGPGAVVDDLILKGRDEKNSGSNVVVSGLCNGITDLIIEMKLSRYGEIKSIVRKHETYAFVAFKDAAGAYGAINALSGSNSGSWLTSKVHKCGQKKCSLTNIITLAHTPASSSIMLQETTVKIQWYAPSKSARAIFHDKSLAQKAADGCNGKMMKGRELKSELKKPGPRQRHSFSVILSGIDPSCSQKQIKKFIKKNSKTSPFVVNVGESPFHDSCGTQIVREVLESFGRLIFFQEAEKVNVLKRKALAKFQRASDASKACAELSSTPRPELGGSRIFISRLFSGKVRLQASIYHAIKADATDLLQALDEMNHIRHKVHVIKTVVTISLQADTPEGISKAKAVLTPMISGFCLMANKSPLWHDYFNSVHAKIKFVELNNHQAGSAYAHCDSRRREIRLYGSVDARKVLGDAIKQLLESVKQQEHAVPLTPEQFAFCARGGKSLIDKISSYTKSSSISLDLKTKSLIVRSHTNEARKISGVIGKEMEATMENFPKKDFDKMCPVCFCPAGEDEKESTIDLDCTHSYCCECFNSWIMSGRNCSFPLNCLHEGCNKPIQLNELEGVLDEGDLLSLLRASIDYHVNRNLDQLHFCPSPECEGIYRILPDQDRVQNCPTCSLSICTKCNVEEHFDLTCAQHMIAKLPPQPFAK